MATRCSLNCDSGSDADSSHPKVLMKKLIVLLVSTVGSSMGWWLGAHVGIMTAFMVSMVGTGLGIWGGVKLAKRYEI